MKSLKKTALTSAIALTLLASCAFGMTACDKKDSGNSGDSFDSGAPTVEVTEEQWNAATEKWKLDTENKLSPCRVSVYKTIKTDVIHSQDYEFPHDGYNTEYRKTEQSRTIYYTGNSIYVDIEIKQYRKSTDINYDTIENRYFYITVENGTGYMAIKRTLSPDPENSSKEEWEISHNIINENVPYEYQISDEQFMFRSFIYCFNDSDTFAPLFLPSDFYDRFAVFALSDGKYTKSYTQESSYSDYTNTDTISLKFDENENVTFLSYNRENYLGDEFNYCSCNPIIKYSHEQKMAIKNFNNVTDEVVPAEAKKAIADYKAANAN